MRRSRGTLHTWVHIIEKLKRKLPSQENDGVASQPHLDFLFYLKKCLPTYATLFKKSNYCPKIQF